jgi:parvulin-like peptidyl-prolyl isomerase
MNTLYYLLKYLNPQNMLPKILISFILFTTLLSRAAEPIKTIKQPTFSNINKIGNNPVSNRNIHPITPTNPTTNFNKINSPLPEKIIPGNKKPLKYTVTSPKNIVKNPANASNKIVQKVLSTPVKKITPPKNVKKAVPTSLNKNPITATKKVNPPKKTTKKVPPKRLATKKTPPKKVRPYYTASQQKLLDQFKKLIPKKIAIIDGKAITQNEFYEFFLNSLPARRPPNTLTIQAAPYIFAVTIENMVNNIILDKYLTSQKIIPNEKETHQYYQKLLSKLSPVEKQLFEARLAKLKQTQDNWIKRLVQDKDIQREICHFNFFQKEIAQKITIPEGEVRNYYNQNSRRFQHPEYANIAIIRKSFHPRKKGDKALAKQKIEAIHNQLVKNPKLFNQLAQKESDCSSKANGGQLGIVYRHMLYNKIDKVVFAMKNNTISQVLEVNNAFYIIKCIARYNARTLSYNEVKTQIVELLQQQEMHLKINEFFHNLRKKHKIQIFIKMPRHQDIKMEIPKDAKFQ